MTLFLQISLTLGLLAYLAAILVMDFRRNKSLILPGTVVMCAGIIYGSMSAFSSVSTGMSVIGDRWQAWQHKREVAAQEKRAMSSFYWEGAKVLSGAYSYISRRGASASRQRMDLTTNGLKIYGKSGSLIDHVSFTIVDDISIDFLDETVQIKTADRQITISQLHQSAGMSDFYQTINKSWQDWKSKNIELSHSQKMTLIRAEQQRRARVLARARRQRLVEQRRAALAHQRQVQALRESREREAARRRAAQPSISDRLDNLWGFNKKPAPQKRRARAQKRAAKPVRGCGNASNCMEAPNVAGWKNLPMFGGKGR